MQFNVSKCKVLRVARTKSIFERDYFLGGIRLERVDVENDLGVLVAYNLNWNSHVDHITSRAQKMLNLLHRSLRVKIYLTSKPRNCSI